MTFPVYVLLLAEAVFAVAMMNRAGLFRSKASLFIGMFFAAAAFALRGALFNYETLDYQDFLKHWVDFYRNYGGFRGLGYSIGNYNIPYLYFLAMFSYSSVRDLYLIKLLTCFFDVVLAYSAAELCLLMTRNAKKALAAFIAVLFLPTVVLNGALWGQCDSIYVSLALLGLVLALKDRPVLSMLCMTLSFGFKLQAVFLLPVCAVLWMYKKYRIEHFLVFPAAYSLLVMPAVLCGRPFMDAIMLYFNQAGSVGDGLNYNSPSVYSFFWRYDLPDYASKIGVAAAFAALALILLICFVRRDRLSNTAVIAAALCMSILIPYFLPHMHDRYFFAADVLSVIAASAFPLLVPAALGVQFASLLGYHAYLKMRYLLYMDKGAMALIPAALLAVGWLIWSLRSDEQTHSDG